MNTKMQVYDTRDSGNDLYVNTSSATAEHHQHVLQHPVGAVVAA